MKLRFLYILAICFGSFALPAQAQSDSLGEFLNPAWVCPTGMNEVPSLSIEPYTANLKVPVYVSTPRELHVRVYGVDHDTIPVTSSGTIIVPIRNLTDYPGSFYAFSAELYDATDHTTSVSNTVGISDVFVWTSRPDFIGMVTESWGGSVASVNLTVAPFDLTTGPPGTYGCFEHHVILHAAFVTDEGDSTAMGEVDVTADGNGPHQFTYTNMGSVDVTGCVYAWLSRRDMSDMPMFEETNFSTTYISPPMCDIPLVGQTAGLDENTASVIGAAYPNPSTGTFHVNIREATDYKIVDLSGREIESGYWHSGAHEINATSWSSGIYALICKDQQTQRLIRE